LSMISPLVLCDAAPAGKTVGLKLENLQPIGSFKIRPIGNAVLARARADLSRGIYTTSTGNSALGVAFMAQRLGITATAVVPANVPFHMQLIDKFAMAVPVSGSHGTAASTPVANEDIWISGRAGEQRFCGGCHENRTVPSSIAPGVQENVLHGAVNLDVPRVQRVSTNYTYGNVRGVPWDLAIQPILTAKCASCHNGDASKSYNPSYTVTDMTSGTMQTFVFDLRDQKVDVTVGERMTSNFTASYLSLMGLGEILGDDVVSITGTPPNYVQAASAETSSLITLLNPPQRFPAVDTSVRLVPGAMPHPVDVAGVELTPDEYYILGLNIDMGGQFFFRENLDEYTN